VRAILVCLALLVVVPATASAASYEYLTSYIGVYDFNRSEDRTSNEATQHYVWASFDYDKVTVHRNGTFVTRHTSYLAARGHFRSVQVMCTCKRDLPPATFIDDCTITSALTPLVNSVYGSNVQPVPVSQNPSIGVAWELPDYSTDPYPSNDTPPFTVTGTLNETGTDDNGVPYSTPCTDHTFATRFLVWADSRPGDGPRVTQKLRDVFSGGVHIRYSDISGGRVWRRAFHNATSKDQNTFGGVTVTVEVKVDSEVSFQRVDGQTGTNKIGAILLQEGFASLDGQGTAADPAGTSGSGETVVVPGMGDGNVSLDVHATVVGRHRSAATAASSTLLSQGTARVRGTSRPVRIRLVPTAAGRSLLTASHPVIKASYVLRFTRRGSKRALSATHTFTIPARP
jgi:hypothetical protein